MAKSPSAETQLRTLRSELKRVREERDDARSSTIHYRQRAEKSEQESEEWKRRFDTLLNREPSP